MMGKSFMAKDKMSDYAAHVETPSIPLNHMRMTIAVIRYLNHQRTPPVNHRLTNIVNDVHDQLRYGQDTWNGNNPGSPVRFAEFWQEWVADFFNNC